MAARQLSMRETLETLKGSHTLYHKPAGRFWVNHPQKGLINVSEHVAQLLDQPYSSAENAVKNVTNPRQVTQDLALLLFEDKRALKVEKHPGTRNRTPLRVFAPPKYRRLGPRRKTDEAA